MHHVGLAFGVFLVVVVPVLFVILGTWRGHITENRKNAVSLVLASVQLGVIAAGGYWVAMQFLLGEKDVIGPRITVDSLKIEATGYDNIDAERCHLIARWDLENRGTEAAGVDRVDVSILGGERSNAPESSDEPYLRQGELESEFERTTIDGPQRKLRPGTKLRWSQGLVLPQSLEREYRLMVEVYVEGDDSPLVLARDVDCEMGFQHEWRIGEGEPRQIPLDGAVEEDLGGFIEGWDDA